MSVVRAVFVVLGLACVPTAVAQLPPSGGLVSFPRQKKTFEELAKDLGDRRAGRRAEAVRGLAGLASLEAWKLVICALADGEAEVADEAQLALAGMEDPAAAALLASSAGLGSGTALVRRRAAEALGRVPAAVDASAFVRFLGAQDVDVRRLIAWSLERRARGRRVPAEDVSALSRALVPLATKDAAPPVRAAAIAALAEIDPAAARSIVAAAVAKGDAVVRCAALASARVLDPAEPVEFAKKHLANGPFAVRATALELVGAEGTKPACRVLVDRLERESSLRLRWIAVRELQRLSGSDVELNLPFWKAWVERLADDWTFAPRTGAEAGNRKPQREPLGPETSQFLGLEIGSEALAILIDLSGSIRLPGKDGKVAKDVVDRELGRTLDGFSKRTRFNLVPYGTKPERWAEACRPATKETVADAKRFFAATDAGGYGNLWAALELALQDPEVENLLVLTDGQITASEHVNVELVRELLVERLRFRKIAVDVLLVGARPLRQAPWRALCAATGGRMLAVELE
ncbi:MAG: hypothetical protein IPJ77_13870 [Planctomycetes bacterium]|nr:hypothetical protein [Planctomycetota bacterium]